MNLVRVYLKHDNDPSPVFRVRTPDTHDFRMRLRDMQAFIGRSTFDSNYYGRILESIHVVPVDMNDPTERCLIDATGPCHHA
jgi:hypothetical protein